MKARAVFIMGVLLFPSMSVEARPSKQRFFLHITSPEAPASGAIIGGSRGATWQKDTAIQRKVRKGQRYWLFSRKGFVGSSTGSKATLSEASGSAYNVSLKLPKVPQDTPLLAISGKQKPKSDHRPLEVLKPTKSHRDALQLWVKSLRLAKTLPGKVLSVWRVD
ncbi:MAG: hypothetical protein JRH20_17705, partial [Deltaproteobacteria bacterium]|nr:hypothetical protein [Deltaproteobacteria bacterium]